MSFIQITFRSMQHSPTVEYHIKKHFNKVLRIYNKVSHCKVVIAAEQKNKHKGKLFSANIYMKIPGHELACKKQNQNLYIAISEGFSGIEKLLKKQGKKKLTTNTIINYFMKNKGGSSNAPNVLEIA